MSLCECGRDGSMKIRCKICGREFEQITWGHLKTHGITFDEYREKFPDALLVSEDYHKKSSNSHKIMWEDPEYRNKNHTNYGKEGWNKGETKETNEIVKESTEKMIKSKKEFYQTEEGRKLAEECGNRVRGKKPWNYGMTKETNDSIKKYGENSSKTKREFNVTEEGQRWQDEHNRGENAPMHGKFSSRKGLTKETDESGSIKRVTEKLTGRQLTEEHLKNILKAVCANPNKKEQYLQWLLYELFPKEYKFVGDGSVIIGGHCPDFININGQKKLIEFYGDYWHKGDDEGNRIFQFKLFGFDTLVIWEHELNPDEIEMTIAKIMEFHLR